MKNFILKVFLQMIRYGLCEKPLRLHLKLSPHNFDLYMIRNDVKISFQENDNSKTLFSKPLGKSENVFVESKILEQQF